MDVWFAEQQERLRALPCQKRYLFDRIDWNQRCLGLIGSRGVGKTTLLLQYLKSHYAGSDRALYISVDHPRFQSVSLYDFAGEFYRYGGEVLILDETHKYPDWSSHLKAVYDGYTELKVYFSGSSLLKLKKQKADLSRRTLIYQLPGLSFREYLSFCDQKQNDVVSLQDIIERHTELVADLKINKPLKYFQEYLKYGYYPFILEGRSAYHAKINEVVNQVLEVDMPYVNNIATGQIAKLKKFLYMLSISVPHEINIQKFSSMTEISRPKIYEYLENLKDAGLINSVRAVGKGYKVMSKPEKVYLENTNLSYAIAGQTDTGTGREAFFVNQIKNSFSDHPVLIDNQIELSPSGDFKVGGKYTFEIGGKQKGFKQIKHTDNAYVVADGIESGFGNKIPLWLFGFLY